MSLALQGVPQTVPFQSGASQKSRFLQQASTWPRYLLFPLLIFRVFALIISFFPLRPAVSCAGYLLASFQYVCLSYLLRPGWAMGWFTA